MIFTEVLNSFRQQGAFAGTVAENWLQGRTLYGGLTAALCLEGVYATFSDLPPLRSAQISFIGPAEGRLKVDATILRQGKSVTFVNADLIGDKGLAARAVFAFGAARPSGLDTHFLAPPSLPSPDISPPLHVEGRGPAFAENFDSRLAKGAFPVSASQENDHFIWVRHIDERASSIVALLALADMPPPAIMPMFIRPAPISTMTWSLNILADHLSTDGGWWLLRTTAENASEGYSSQNMIVWNTRGEPVIAGRQSVAIFF